MVGIIVVTHGSLGEALLSTASMIIGDNEMIFSLSLNPGEGFEDLEKNLNDVLTFMKGCDGVICFADLLGGTPSKVLCNALLKNKNLEVITGVNLPILLEAIISRNTMKFEDLVHYIVERGKDSINNLGSIFSNKN